MTDEMRIIWLDVVRQAKKNIESDSPYKGDEAIVQIDDYIKSSQLRMCQLTHLLDLAQSKVALLEAAQQ